MNANEEELVGLMVKVAQETNAAIERESGGMVKARNGLGVSVYIVMVLGKKYGIGGEWLRDLGVIVNLVANSHLHTDRVVDKHADRLRKYNLMGIEGNFPDDKTDDEDYFLLSHLHGLLSVYAVATKLNQVRKYYEDEDAVEIYSREIFKLMGEVDTGMMREVLKDVRLRGNSVKKDHFKTGWLYNMEMSMMIHLMKQPKEEAEILKEVFDNYSWAFEMQDELDDCEQDAISGNINSLAGEKYNLGVNKRDACLKKMGQKLSSIGLEELGIQMEEMVVNYKTGNSKIVRLVREAERRGIGFVPKEV